MSTSRTETLEVTSRQRIEMIDVTSPVRAAISRAGVADGIAIVACPHTTAGLTLQENADPDVRRDLTAHLSRLVPEDGGFRHAEGNSDAHIKSTLVGPTLTLIVEGGRPLLGTWQAVYFCEHDGPRTRHLHVKVIAG